MSSKSQHATPSASALTTTRMRKFTSTILPPLRQTARVPAQPRVVGLALVVTAALLFVVNAGVSRVVLRAGVSPAELTLSRITGTAAVLLLVARALPPPGAAAAAGTPGRAARSCTAWSGVALLQWVYFVAIDRLPVGLALLLEYLAPLLVVLWARFVQGEVVRRSAWVGPRHGPAGARDGHRDREGRARLRHARASWPAWPRRSASRRTSSSASTASRSLDPLQVALWSFGDRRGGDERGLADDGVPVGTARRHHVPARPAGRALGPVGVLVLWVTVLGHAGALRARARRDAHAVRVDHDEGRDARAGRGDGPRLRVVPARRSTPSRWSAARSSWRASSPPRPVGRPRPPGSRRTSRRPDRALMRPGALAAGPTFGVPGRRSASGR